MTGCPGCGGNLPPDARFCPTCGGHLAGTAAAAPVETVRRTVTVVFCDLTGSTALGGSHDPELMRAVITRYFAVVSEVLDRHGGTVEKFIGDAVMAVFGVPALHEDDALRAVRAAVGARAAVDTLNEEIQRVHGLRLTVRLGVETGEVVVGEGARGTVATGDAVNVAARLEQAAGAGDVLLGPGTWRLVRDWAHAEKIPPLALKGKVGDVAAWRLLDVEGEGSERPLAGTRMVGREQEMGLVRATFERCVQEGACHLVTLVGTPGVGKTRLMREVLDTLPPDTTVLRGRCLPYGDAMGLWPVREILRAAAGLTGGEDDELARSRVTTLVAGDDEAASLQERLAPLAGLPGLPPSKEETNWALRRLVEVLGRRGPVVVVVDDLHWAEPVLLDLVDHLADWVHDTPLLLVCLCRPELLDERPTWGGGRVNATSLLLSPLGHDASAELVESLAGDAPLAPEVAVRVRDAAAGVPLYAEHLVAMLLEESQITLVDGRWQWAEDADDLATPPTIAAILAARLERLAPEQRTVLESAAVVGEVFYRGAVAELTDTLPGDVVDTSLTALVRRGLARSEFSDIAGENALRFAHVLVRDAAYHGMSKSRRADQHLRMARWLQKRPDAGPDGETLVGHHLARAVLLRDALGPRDADAQDLSDEAVDVLRRAARRVEVTDQPGAGLLLETAATIVRDPAQLCRLRLRQLDLVASNGVDVSGAALAWRAAARAAQDADDEKLRLLVALAGSNLGVMLPGVVEEVMTDEQIDAAVQMFRDGEDDEGLVQALLAKAERLHSAAIWGASLDLYIEATPAAERMGDQLRANGMRLAPTGAYMFGPLPPAEGLAFLAEIATHPSLQQRNVQLRIAITRVPLLAMLDRTEDARAAADEARREIAELHHGQQQAAFAIGDALLMLGDVEAAETVIRPTVDALTRVGEVGLRSTLLPMLGVALLLQGREEEARRCAEQSRDISPPGDITSQATWRWLMAMLESRRGHHDEAVRLADEALTWTRRSDDIGGTGEVQRDRAQVLFAAGRHDEGREALEDALRLFNTKGHVRGAREVGTMLGRL